MKTGKPAPARGIRMPRQRRFEAILPTESGVKVRSKYECRCADFFTQHKVAFQYEPLMLLGGRQFRPDFFLPEHELFVEICGYGHMPHYRDRVKQKQELYEQHGMRAIFVHYSGKGSLEELLQAELAKVGVTLFVKPPDLGADDENDSAVIDPKTDG